MSGHNHEEDKIGRFLKEVQRAKREVGHFVKWRLEGFRANRKTEFYLFRELCFCLLTANFSAEGIMRIQNEIGDGFLTLSRDDLVEELRKLGHRYPEARATFIVSARRLYGKLSTILRSISNSSAVREWLVKNVKGLGYKEASHFLRNVGYFDLAILDRHVLRYMKKRGFIDEAPKNLTRKKYLEIEEVFKSMARRAGVAPGELDLYIWYLMTGKVLK